MRSRVAGQVVGPICPRLSERRAPWVLGLTCALVLACASPAFGQTYSDLILGDSPVGYWRFGESAGPSANDSSPNGNDGTYFASPTLGVPGAMFGDPDTAVSMNGTSQEVRVPDDNTLDVGDSFTIEGWVKRSSTAKTTPLFNKGSQSFQLVVLGGPGNQVSLRKANVTTVARSGTSVLADGEYHHVVATKDGPNSTKIYIDGVESTVQVDGNRVIENNTVQLRFSGSGSNRHQLDEFALYDVALSEADVLEHYRAGVGGTLNCTPTSVSFPDTAVGQTSASQSVTCSSGGPGPVTVSGATVTPTPAQYTLSDGCAGVTLDPGGANSCTIGVQFTPTVAGPANATLNIAHNGSNPSPFPISLSGTAPSEQADLELSLDSVQDSTVSFTEIRYVMTVFNDGPSDADAPNTVTAEATLPESVIFDRFLPESVASCSYTPSTRKVTCTTQTLDASEIVTFRFAGLAGVGTHTVTATTFSDLVPDPDPSDNSDSVTNTVVDPPG